MPLIVPLDAVSVVEKLPVALQAEAAEIEKAGSKNPAPSKDGSLSRTNKKSKTENQEASSV